MAGAGAGATLATAVAAAAVETADAAALTDISVDGTDPFATSEVLEEAPVPDWSTSTISMGTSPATVKSRMDDLEKRLNCIIHDETPLIFTSTSRAPMLTPRSVLKALIASTMSVLDAVVEIALVVTLALTVALVPILFKVKVKVGAVPEAPVSVMLCLSGVMPCDGEPAVHLDVTTALAAPERLPVPTVIARTGPTCIGTPVCSKMTPKCIEWSEATRPPVTAGVVKAITWMVPTVRKAPKTWSTVAALAEALNVADNPLKVKS